MSPATSATTLIDDFVDNLEALAQRDATRADLARLRRCGGRPLSQCSNVFPLFYRLLPYGIRGNEREEELYFLVATLFAKNPRSSSAHDIGASMVAVRAAMKARSKGIDRRMLVLIDASREDLTFRLRHVVTLAAANEVGINWRSLLSDLQRWGHPARHVQRRWARNYFGAPRDVAPGVKSKTGAKESED